MQYKIALFGEAEKGKFKIPYKCKSLIQLLNTFGNPPKDSFGLTFAIQALMYEREVLFFRDKEEGFGYNDYFPPLKNLSISGKDSKIDAICMPGVGDPKIIDETESICKIHKSILLTTEKDLFDYLTSFSILNK